MITEDLPELLPAPLEQRSGEVAEPLFLRLGQRGGRVRHNSDDGRIHRGSRPERTPRHPEDPLHVCHGAYADRESPILSGAGLREDPIRDLALHHQQDSPRAWALEQPEDNRRSEIVGDIADDLEAIRTRSQVGSAGRQNILVEHLDSWVVRKARAELGGEMVVELHEYEPPLDLVHSSGQPLGQSPSTRPNLEYGVTRSETEFLDDPVRYVLIDEEVLSQRALRSRWHSG